MRTLPFFRASAPLTPVERLAKRRLILQDTLALLGIFASTVVLAVLTYLIFRSYSQHQQDAAARWKRRGEDALLKHNANAAVFDLRTTLGYAPGDRATELELASALAMAGRLQEATVYFNTLWEKEPGNGNINLQLARLAVRQQQTAAAIEHYHAAIYGVWEGDGAIRRRQVRLELVRYLISRGRFGEARDELLIAAGNDTATRSLLEVAGLMADAHAPNDAVRLYREVAGRRPIVTEAVEGAGQMAFEMGHYQTAKLYLERAVTVAGSGAPPLVNRPLTERNLQIATGVLAAYPSPQLPERERRRRVTRMYDIAQARFASCSRQLQGGAGPAAGGQGGAGGSNETGHASKPSSGATPTGNTANPAEMSALTARWQQARPRLRIADLEMHPELEPVTLQLVYDTEQITARACGPPTGADVILLHIAAAPDAVDQ